MKALQRLIRDAGGIRALSRDLGYRSHTYLSRIASGAVTPSFEFLRRVREHTGVLLDPSDFEQRPSTEHRA